MMSKTYNKYACVQAKVLRMLDNNKFQISTNLIAMSFFELHFILKILCIYFLASSFLDKTLVTVFI